MDENCVITPCEKGEYEEPIVPSPTESDLVQVYDSIEQITNPNSNHIYVVGNDTYVFDGVSFVPISGCDIATYTGDYTVTAPSDGNLVLLTKDKLMEDDVTVEANRSLENALIEQTQLDVYENDEITRIVGPYCFTRTQIKKIILPNVTTIENNYNFDGGGVSLVEEIHLPRWSSGGGYALFDNNPNLKLIDFGNINGLPYMRTNPNLRIWILRRTLNSLRVGNSNGFTNTPFHPSGTGGYVYVPQNLISAYQNSSEWQTYVHVLEFRPIEGSEYEIDGIESTNSSSQSFSLSSPLNDNFDTPLETFDTPLEDEFIPTEELESEE